MRTCTHEFAESASICRHCGISTYGADERSCIWRDVPDPPRNRPIAADDIDFIHARILQLRAEADAARAGAAEEAAP